MKKSFQTWKLGFTALLVFLFSCVSAQWVKKANALKLRSELGSVVYNGKVYTFLGFRNYDLNIETSSEVYDPASNTWKQLASLPSDKAVTHQGMALIDDNVWLIGGRVGTNPGPLTSEVWIYNISNNSWSAGPRIRDPATGNTIPWAAGGAVFLGRTLHLFGGFAVDGCDHDQDKYHLTLDVDDWKANPTQARPWKNELVPLPLKRNHFATVVLAGKIYAIGGQVGHDCGEVDKTYAHVYNPATNTWKQLPSLPAPRSHIEASTFCIDGKIYIAAGQGTNSENTRLVTIFDPAGNSGAGSWTNDNNLLLPASYEGISAKVVNNTFIISHGGMGGSRYPQRVTYSRTLTRKPVYKLGFPAECLQLNNSSASSLTGNTWLYTIDGTKTYTTSSNASWLVISKNKSGTATSNAVDIEVTANVSGLVPGNYNAVVTATGTGTGTSYTSAQLCVNLTVLQQSGTGKYTLSTTAYGNGTITRSPDLSNYGEGSSVVLTAKPSSGQQFTGWSGSVSGTTNPVTLVMNANKVITGYFQPVTPSSLITNLTESSPNSYVIGQLKTNVPYYTDRSYYVTAVPAFLNLAPFIKSPNDDKSVTSSSLLQFTLTQSATVYVAYDPRATALPAWLSGWQKSTSTLGITDASLTYLNLYSKVFPAGKVSLGGNLASPAAGSKNNYIVIAVAQPNQLSGTSFNKMIADEKDGSSFAKNGAGNVTVKIFPNPFYGGPLHIRIDHLPKHQQVNITLADISGKVYQTLSEMTDATGALNKYINFQKANAAGVYTLQVHSTAFSKFIKVVIN